MDENRVRAYLARIGLTKEDVTAHSGETLKKIQYHHVTTVPYENLSILAGEPILLDIDSLYDKIVTNRRGGYCFEVNGLLTELLRSLGFSVTEYFARFLRGETAVPMRRHRVLEVTADDGVWLCDVGIGAVAPKYAVRIEDGTEQAQGDECYRILHDERGCVLEELYHGYWRPYISYYPEPQYPMDFIQPSFFCEYHPDSPFNREAIIAIKTAEGRKTVDGDIYREFEGNTLTHIEEKITETRFREILRDTFGIRYEGAVMKKTGE